MQGQITVKYLLFGMPEHWNFLSNLYGVQLTLLKLPVAYTSLLYPILEYVCTVWNPHSSKDKLIIEHVQQRAACGSHWNPTIRKW